MEGENFQNRVFDIVSPLTLDIESTQEKSNTFVIESLSPSDAGTNFENCSVHSLLENNPWIPYVGDCKALDAYLESKSRNWIIPKFLNALFRGISQVLFANNPVTGLIILLSLFWSDTTVGLATTATATVAIITALLMKQDLSNIRAGLTTYNAVLVGSVTASLWYPIYGEQLTPKIRGFMIAGAVLSVFVTSGLANILSSYKFSLPCLTMPFNVVNLLLFICLMPPLSSPKHELSGNSSIIITNLKQGLEEKNNSTFTRVVINVTDFGKIMHEINGVQVQIQPWDNEHRVIEAKEETGSNELDVRKTISGIICAMGQVFAIENLAGSILIYLAIFIYSPTLCFMCLLGATLSTVTGLIFTPGPNYKMIYAGIWGYNGILSAAAVGGFFIVMTCHSFWTAIANVLFTVLLQHALALIFSSMRLPVFTLPFVLSTLLFLSVSSAEDRLPRVTNISFPEMHRYEHWIKMGKKNKASEQNEN